MSNNNFDDKSYYIQYFDDNEFPNFSEIVKEEFVEICCGYCNCSIFDVSDIAAEFLERIKGRSSENIKRRIGFIGELLYYIFVKHKLSFLRAINPMLNMEERSPKKGYDMLSEYDNEIWYSEVKSGEHGVINLKSLNKLNLEKIGLAYRDLSARLNNPQKNNNYWITAKMKLNSCLSEKSDIDRVAKILDSDMKASKIKNKIVVSVIFGKSIEKLDEGQIVEKLKKIREKDEKVVIVCIREENINRTISIIKELCNNG